MKERVYNYLKSNKEEFLVFFLLLLGFLVRGINLGVVPGGLNQDEAFAGYEAFSLLNYGVDTAGYHNPCYFVSWGSGMNVLESYLAIPFVFLFGCTATAIRMPQYVFGCISLIVFYLLLKKMFSKKTAIIGLGLLAISPWHILLSRWGLESNMAPAFLLIGFYFLIKGIDDGKYMIFSAIFYGLSLYAYSITWIVVPLTLIVVIIYLIVVKKKISLPHLLISMVVLIILAFPLILFMLVNKGVIPEITTSFFSVPKLVQMRSSEISLSGLVSAESWNNLFKVLIGQNDGISSNCIEDFGMFYKFSWPFIIVGAVKLGTVAVEKSRNRKFSREAVVLLGMLCSVFTCLMLAHLNMNKSNSLHFFTLILLAVGVSEVMEQLKQRTVISKAIVACFGVSFVFFLSFYFDEYKENISGTFNYGLEDAVEFVNDNNFEKVYVCQGVYYSQILFYDQTPHDEFANTVEYVNYPSAFLDIATFGKYDMQPDYMALDEDSAYIIKVEKQNEFTTQGYTVEMFENYGVAYKE